MNARIEEGDHVSVRGGKVHWIVAEIDSRIDPLGVRLTSGMTGRTRYESYESLTPHPWRTEEAA